MKTMNILVSACLLGVSCRYSGDGYLHNEILQLKKEHHLIPICPEILGGLPTPRIPCEIVGDKVINQQGEDITEAFNKGAMETVSICKHLDVDVAILKKNSPSCGYGKIYDGTFTKKLMIGNGITTRQLIQLGIPIYNEDNFKDFLILDKK